MAQGVAAVAAAQQPATSTFTTPTSSSMRSTSSWGKGPKHSLATHCCSSMCSSSKAAHHTSFMCSSSDAAHHTNSSLDGRKRRRLGKQKMASTILQQRDQIAFMKK
eukprot:6276210-Karenia_brevis.AAC.1